MALPRQAAYVDAHGQELFQLTTAFCFGLLEDDALVRIRNDQGDAECPQ